MAAAGEVQAKARLIIVRVGIFVKCWREGPSVGDSRNHSATRTQRNFRPIGIPANELWFVAICRQSQKVVNHRRLRHGHEYNKTIISLTADGEKKPEMMSVHERFVNGVVSASVIVRGMTSWSFVSGGCRVQNWSPFHRTVFNWITAELSFMSWRETWKDLQWKTLFRWLWHR